MMMSSDSLALWRWGYSLPKVPPRIFFAFFAAATTAAWALVAGVATVSAGNAFCLEVVFHAENLHLCFRRNILLFHNLKRPPSISPPKGEGSYSNLLVLKFSPFGGELEGGLHYLFYKYFFAVIDIHAFDGGFA